MEYYQPQAIVFQSSTEFLTQGNTNDFYLTLYGHGACLEFLKNFDVPILILGGGDCNAEDAASFWIYQTAIAIGQDLCDIIPCNNWFKHDIPSLDKKEIQHAYKLIYNQCLKLLKNSPFEMLNSSTRSCDSPLSPTA